jgi:hypothetical protein
MTIGRKMLTLLPIQTKPHPLLESCLTKTNQFHRSLLSSSIKFIKDAARLTKLIAGRSSSHLPDKSEISYV